MYISIGPLVISTRDTISGLIRRETDIRVNRSNRHIVRIQPTRSLPDKALIAAFTAYTTTGLDDRIKTFTEDKGLIWMERAIRAFGDVMRSY